MAANGKQNVLFRKHERYAVLQINRPEYMNALNFETISGIASSLRLCASDPEIKCAIITGNEKSFAAGADIRELAGMTSPRLMLEDNFSVWDEIALFRKPLLAAIEGYALGGGCELAMNCDIIVASESAVFGQPEINLGIMPGAGGTQRLTALLGKHRAMRYILTGERMSAAEAERMGLVSYLVPEGRALAEAERIASDLCSKSLPALLAAKQAVLAANQQIASGIRMERELFYLLFSTMDQREGMNAFIEKRKPRYRDA